MDETWTYYAQYYITFHSHNLVTDQFKGPETYSLAVRPEKKKSNVDVVEHNVLCHPVQ